MSGHQVYRHILLLCDWNVNIIINFTTISYITHVTYFLGDPFVTCTKKSSYIDIAITKDPYILIPYSDYSAKHIHALICIYKECIRTLYRIHILDLLCKAFLNFLWRGTFQLPSALADGVVAPITLGADQWDSTACKMLPI